MSPDPVPPPDPGLEELLEYLRQTRGFEFTSYKRTSLKRRIDRRLQALGLEDYESYRDHLEVHTGEFPVLFNTILINVTGFFRDPAVWDLVATEAIPQILKKSGRSSAIRIWTAGCASGEEAYTIAMLFAEAMGPAAFRERGKVYATDVDEEALAQSRLAAYDARHVQAVPEPLLKKYFERTNGGYIFHRDLRRSVIFGRHDLIQDSPISRVDIITCRNTLMYFNAEAQSKILRRFHFALNEGGFLLLGRAEMPFSDAALFTPVHLKHRLFRASPTANQRDRLLMLAQAGREGDHGGEASTLMREAAFESDSIPQIVVDAAGFLQLSNEAARRLFGLSAADIGRQLRDLELSYRPVELRSCVEQATLEHRVVTVNDVEWQIGDGGTHYLDVAIMPLIDVEGGALGTKITFSDVTRVRALQKELQRANMELETAYEELQSTNEELETTNEELQSTVEELETTNEELQSTNEELETMNEELQSTNEELQTMNDELRTRSTELNDVNSFLEAILSSMSTAVVVVDGDLRIQEWNRRAEHLWGLREEEVRGQHLMNLDIGMPVAELKSPVRATLSGMSSVEALVLPATNRRGRSFNCTVTFTPLAQGAEIRGVLLVMTEDRPRGGM